MFPTRPTVGRAGRTYETRHSSASLSVYAPRDPPINFFSLAHIKTTSNYHVKLNNRNENDKNTTMVGFRDVTKQRK